MERGVFLGEIFLVVGESHMRVGVERRSLIARRPAQLTPGTGRHRQRRREHASSQYPPLDISTNLMSFFCVANN